MIINGEQITNLLRQLHAKTIHIWLGEAAKDEIEERDLQEYYPLSNPTVFIEISWTKDGDADSLDFAVCDGGSSFEEAVSLCIHTFHLTARDAVKNDNPSARLAWDQAKFSNEWKHTNDHVCQ
jgi:hypothetical protein